MQVSGKPIVKLEGGANHQDTLGVTLLSSMTAGDDRCCGGVLQVQGGVGEHYTAAHGLLVLWLAPVR